MNLYHAFAQAAERHAGLPALQWEGGGWTYAELMQYANLAGHALKNRHGGEGRNIAMLCPNTPHFIPALLGILGAGHAAVPLNPLLNPEELVNLATHSDAPALLYDPLMEEKIAAVKAAMHNSAEFVPIPSLYTEGTSAERLDPSPGPEALSMILYTSGTTGNPKGVMLSHRNIYSNSESFSSVLEFGEEDSFVCVLPLFHTFAMTVVIFGAMVKGSKVLLHPQFVPQKVMEEFVKEKSVIFIGVPPMMHLLTRLAPPEVAQNHNLRVVVSGGGPLPVEVARAFEKKFNHELLEGYGLTEAAPVISHNHPGKNVVGTIGIPIPGCEVEIRDESGNALPPGGVGELCATGDNIMIGYYKNEAATREAFHSDGWLRTGDMAMFCEEGHLRIMGRYKDLIVSAGENIYPREVEETLLKFPGILECAVVGKPDKLRAEVPEAFIVAAPEARESLTPKALRQYCKEHLADYKIPEAFHVVDQLPKTATGKIRKEVIKETHYPELAAQKA